MKGILLIYCVGVIFIMAITPGKAKAMTEKEERQRAMKRDIELGLLAIEPPVIDDIAVAMDSPRIHQAEEDRDHLHHSHRRFQQQFQREPLRVQARKVLDGPEEDRDHLHHGWRKP